MRDQDTNSSGGYYRFWSLALPSWATPPAAARRRSGRRILRSTARRMGADRRLAVGGK